MRKRILSLFLALVLVVTLVPITASAVSHGSNGIYGNGTGGVYIDIYSYEFTKLSETPTWGQYAWGESGCAWFASARQWQITGNNPGTIWQGTSWWNNGNGRMGYPTGKTIAAKALACYTGHVSVIEAVSGNQALVSEGGYRDYPNNDYCCLSWKSISTVESSAKGFLGYVYLGGSAPSLQCTWETPSATKITQTNAFLYGKLNYNQNANCTQAGVRVINASTGASVASKDEYVNYNLNYVDMWYDLTEELGVTLTPATTYKYNFYAIVNGKEYWSPVGTFTTEGHAHNYTSIVTAPTCTAQGYTTHYCSCGDSYKDNYTEPDGLHVLGDGVCTRCGARTSGNCGTEGNESSVKWTLSKDGTLTISGTGAIGTPAWRDFYRCIKSVVIKQGVTEVCANAFCKQVYAGGLNKYGYKFIGYDQLTSVTLPNSITVIGNQAFAGNLNLTDITIPSSLQTLGARAFFGCKGLEYIMIPSSVESVSSGVFCECENLKSVTIADGVTAIESYAFAGCVSLKSVSIPDSVSLISFNAFLDCTNMTRINIGGGVTKIGQHPFLGCGKLKEIVISPQNSTFYSADGVIFYPYNGASVLWYYPEGKQETSYVVPDGTSRILTEAFIGNTHLKSVAIPISVTEIDAYAFEKCDNLADIYYSGTKDQWDAVEKHYNITGITIHYNHSHAWNSGVITKAAGCVTSGEITYSCTACGAQLKKEIPAAGHKYTTTVKTPTCTAQGYTTHTCSCGDWYRDNFTNALGHSYGAWEQNKAPTCTAQGTEKRTCTRCNATQTRNVAALGHNYSNGKCTRCGAADPKYVSAPTLKITTVSGHPKIYWNSVSGATKYWIYRSTDGKNFKYYDSTTKTSYTNNATTIGKLYYYKVKAVKVVDGTNKASGYSNTKSIRCKPAAPSLSIARTNGKPQIYWNCIDSATKYWIYRSTDGVNFSYYDSTTKTSYTNKSTTKGKTYYYKVKA
ncbi:MAG: leucine-rich repeat protein, partial [Firmicutes bacterium]|nr:leucine-rich repeat protein [Bacillota bacterium]